MNRRPILRQVLANSAWLLADKSVRMGLGIFIWLWLARYLGEAQFGIYNYSLAFVSLFAAFATLGLDSIVVREIVRNPDRRDELLGTAFLMKAAGGILVLLVTMVLAGLLRPRDPLVIALVAISGTALVLQSFDVIDFWFQSRVMSRYTVIARHAGFLASSVLKIVLITTGASLLAIAAMSLVEASVAAAGLVLAFHINKQSIRRWSAHWHIARSLIRQSWPLLFSSTFVYVNMLIDRIMLGQISGDVEVGLYSAASRLSEIWYLIPVVVGASVAPVLVKEHQLNPARYAEKLQQTLGVLSVAAIFLAVLVTPFSEAIIEMLYGGAYTSAAPMLTVHIWTAVFVFHVSIRSRAYVIESREQLVAVLAFVTMLSNVGLNLWLIPSNGGLGASVASLVSWVLCVIAFPYLFPASRGSPAMFFRSLNPYHLVRLREKPE